MAASQFVPRQASQNKEVTTQAKSNSSPRLKFDRIIRMNPSDKEARSNPTPDSQKAYANSDSRRWYQKKRYLIPSVIMGSALSLSAASGPINESESPSANDISRVEVELDTRPPRRAPQVKNPLFEYIDTKSQLNCSPNYDGCLEVGVGDYDCLRGSGNGPNYTGPVRVIGYDEFDLDRDGDGYACE